MEVAIRPTPQISTAVRRPGEKLENVTITSAVFMNDPLGFLPPKTPGVFGTPCRD